MRHHLSQVPLADPDTGRRRDARPQWIAGAFPLFPVVRLDDGAPWAEANVWLIDMMESKSSPNMLTFASIADDLAAFRRYLDDEGIDWLVFPANKRQRPTYRYSASIRLAVQAGELSPGVARRRMGTVVRFYRWLMTEAGFRPVNAPWVESDRFIEFKDQKGFSSVIEVKSTDRRSVVGGQRTRGTIAFRMAAACARSHLPSSRCCLSR
ncbi:hypothetical protein AB4Y38_25175 [Paraburkholderia sp. EG285A]|uniref:hypothetical protein n=1 Tax=Paraburkholderia sp. EG285A TaxID=3237009 RepID=UPI0034D249E5